MSSGMTVRDVLHKLLDVPSFDERPPGDALVQVTMDGETFFVIDSVFDPYGDGSVVMQVVPYEQARVDRRRPKT